MAIQLKPPILLILVTGGLLGCTGSQPVSPSSTPRTSQNDGAIRTTTPGEKAVVLSGHVSLEGTPERNSVIHVRAFNGFTTVSDTPAGDGTYRVSIPKSTPGTYVALIYEKPRYIPQYQYASVPGRPSTLRLDSVVLRRTLDPDSGYLVGTAYRQILGGKIRSRYGIGSFDQELSVSIQGQTHRSMTVDTTVRVTDQGFYRIQLAPGLYKLETGRGYRVDSVRIRSEHTTVQHLYSGRRMID